MIERSLGPHVGVIFYGGANGASVFGELHRVGPYQLRFAQTLERAFSGIDLLVSPQPGDDEECDYEAHGLHRRLQQKAIIDLINNLHQIIP